MPEAITDRDLTNDVLICLRRIIQLIDIHSKYLIKTVGLSAPQLTILHEAVRKGKQSTSEIARAVSLSQATVTGILERLEKRGFIRRVRDEVDRRKVLVCATPDCHKLLEKTPPLLQESFIDAFGNLQSWEKAMILCSLQRILSMMEVKKVDAALMEQSQDPSGFPL
ncbi:MAG: hypothetical protein AMJ54_05795 [Deltaproteobacteria bacterium SG8_13]|nr:MAG: hypothetical protein AMJ54_05795 [Deltaproteobacteria bacterium SG8_13]